MNRDLIDLLAEFNAQGVEYLVVGAHALAVHGHVRATKDLDVWVRADAANAAWVDRVQVSLDGTPVPVISRHHLIENKRASGRLQDLADVERLEAGDV